MLKRPALLAAAVAIYVVIGLLWATTLGINMMSIRDSDGERTYRHAFFDVVSAEFDDETLWLCVIGRQLHHPDAPADVTEFALSVPVGSLWTNEEQARAEGVRRPSWAEHTAMIPLARVFPDCDHKSGNFRKIPVDKLAETEDIGDFFDGFNGDELRRFLRDRPIRQEVLQIPQSFDAREYSRSRQVVFLHSRPDLSGRRFIDIDVRPQLRKYVIGRGEVLKAFFIDALTYPYQVYVWFIYARGL